MLRGFRGINVVHRLEEHPNLSEILGVLAQLPHIADSDLPLLADQWVNSPSLAAARDRALRPDGPLVLEALAAFDAVSALFAEDLAGNEPWITVDTSVTTLALKSVRDAIAAAYARPVLSRQDHAALLRPWRSVYAVARVDEPDLGPQADLVKHVLQTMTALGGRCHDRAGAALFEALVDRSFVAESDRAEAAAGAFEAAVLTSRRRIWTLIRRTGTEGLSRPCVACRGNAEQDDQDTRRVLTLCLDAACALLVADALSDERVHLLTSGVAALIPLQRRPHPSR